MSISGRLFVGKDDVELIPKPGASAGSTGFVQICMDNLIVPNNPYISKINYCKKKI